MFEFLKRSPKDPEGYVRARMMCLLSAMLLCFAFSPTCFAQEQGYFSQMGHTFSRGVKNLVSFPWEIPATIAKHDREDNGNPRFLRDAAGLADGTYRAVTRLGCGFFDVAFSVVPGQQNELPLTPESFF